MRQLQGWPRSAPVLAGLAVLALLVGTGLWGLDFGYHWDEGKLVHALDRLHTKACRSPLSTTIPPSRTGLPPRYTRWRPPHPGSAWRTPPSISESGSRSSCSRPSVLIWLFAAVIAAGGLPWEAATAVGVLGLSWELAYHLRWIAPDGPLDGLRRGDPLLRSHGQSASPPATLDPIGRAGRRPGHGKQVSGRSPDPSRPAGPLQEVAAERGRPAALPWRGITGPRLPRARGGRPRAFSWPPIW